MNIRSALALCVASTLLPMAWTVRAQDAPPQEVHVLGVPARIHAAEPSCRPEYPAAAVRRNAQGTTVLQFTVDATGKVVATDILRSAGPTPEHQMLDRAAAKALATCAFTPGIDPTGQPITTQVKVTYVWKLE